MTLASFFCLFQKPRYIAMLLGCCFLGCCCSILLLMRTLMMMMRAPAHDEKVTNNWKNKKQKTKSFLRKNGFFFLQTAHKSRSRSSVFLLVHIAQVVLHPSLWLISTPIKTTPNRHKKDNNLSLYCGILFIFGFPASSFLFYFPFALCPYRTSFSFNWWENNFVSSIIISGVIESMAPFKAILFRLKFRWE